MNKKIKTAIIHPLILIIGFFFGYQWSSFNYNDKCLDLGGGKNPGNYPICVIEKIVNKNMKLNGDMMPVEPNNGVGDGIENLGKLLEKNRKIKLMSVKIPTWKFDEVKSDFVIEFSEYEVNMSKAILRSTLKKLFEVKGSDNWNGLRFNSVSINNGKAIINLEGEWSPVGDMSGAYMKHELEAAVFQFSTVNSLEVKLKGKIFDWCIDDESDGESSCPKKQQLWIEKK